MIITTIELQGGLPGKHPVGDLWPLDPVVISTSAIMAINGHPTPQPGLDVVPPGNQATRARNLVCIDVIRHDLETAQRETQLGLRQYRLAKVITLVSKLGY